MAPAATPAEAMGYAKQLAELVSPFSPNKSIEIFAGLMTDPKFHAHQVRLDFAIRLVFGIGNGNRRPKRGEVAELLNTQMEIGRVSRLEDPIEDFFVESLPTRQGQFLIFSGSWEKASIHTELLLRAFQNLPGGAPKAQAWANVFALLRLSTALVERSELRRGVVGEGVPGGKIDVPSDTRLSNLSRRVRFSSTELIELGIEIADLQPFIFNEEDVSATLFNEPGNSPLESRPLFQTKHSVVVASPPNISTAVRSHLINTALKYGVAAYLQFNFLTAQAELLFDSNFSYVPRGQTYVCDDQAYCEQLFEISTGRFLHVIISADGFSGWPNRAFGSITPTDATWAEMLETSMRRAQASASNEPNFLSGMTLWMCSGWGAGRSLGFKPGDDLKDWDFIAAEPADLATMNACKDGKPSDIWRLRQQHTAVERQGFKFSHINGLLNLFHWWRTTDHALFPPQQIDTSPPLLVNFDSGLLLEARKEARRAFDRIAVQDETGRWQIVARVEREDSYKALDNAYASFDDVKAGNLSGVLIDEERSNWWVKLDQGPHNKDRDLYETWMTVLIWAGQVMPHFLNSIGRRKVPKTLTFTIKLESTSVDSDSDSDSDFDFVGAELLSDSQIDPTITVDVNPAEHRVLLTIKPDWFKGFYRPDNYAERILGLNLLIGAHEICGIEYSTEKMKLLVLEAAGSSDFRHRHAFKVTRIIEQLSSQGLTDSFVAIPISAGALAKCGAAWHVRDREAGVRITDKASCLAFLRRFVDDAIQRILADLRPYNRNHLILFALRGLQSALAEEALWRRSARALRAIHGVERDFSMSMSKVMAANAVLRANSMLVELASEASQDEGIEIGTIDFQNFQARAIQLFQTADMFPAYASDRIEPEIHLSPTGDILSKHDFHEAAVGRVAEKRHARDRDNASKEYVARFEKQKLDPLPNEELASAIQVEYGVSISVFREFSVAAAHIAYERNEGVFVLRRSELIEALSKVEFVSEMDFSPLIGRLSLPFRNTFAELPKGYSFRDADLSKLDRRLSLIARPIVSLSEDDNPVLAVAPALIERAFAHNISGALSGALQSQFWESPQMIAFAGASGARTGFDFNAAVASEFEVLGLQAFPSVKPWVCLNHKKTEELKKLGDIDVLVVNSSGTVIWVCEAKDLKLCRTLGEAAQRLSEYRGVLREGKPDKLLRHLRRVEFLRMNSRALAKQLKLPSAPTICGAVIVSAPQPMEQLTHEYAQDSTVVMLDEIVDIPWETGWPKKHRD